MRVLVCLVILGFLTATVAVASPSDNGGVGAYVKDYEHANNVKSCHKVGGAVTYEADAYGVDLKAVYECAVQGARGVGFVDTCYVVHDSIIKSIFGRVPCKSVGCPLGGKRDRIAQTMFFGQKVDPELVYEASLGKSPPRKTVRVDIYYHGTEGAPKHCGYLNVRVPPRNAKSLAAKIIDRSGWTDLQYSFSYSIDGS